MNRPDKEQSGNLTGLEGSSILVTGVLGCVGRATAASLKRRGAAVIGYGRSKIDRSSEDLMSEYLEGDIRDKERIEGAIQRSDAVVHLAAAVHRKLRGAADERTAIETNAEATERICEACAKGSKMLVFASTSAVYGEGGRESLTEESPLHPETLYGKTKAMAEKSVLDSGGTVLRLPLVYGAFDRGNMRRMILAISRNLFVVPGRGEAMLSLIGRWNAAEAIVRSLVFGIQKGGAFNATDDEDVSIGELADLIAKLSGRPRPFRVPKKLLGYAAFAGSVIERTTGILAPLTGSSLGKLTNSHTIDGSKIRSELGFRPVKPLCEGLKEEIDWCLGRMG